MTRLRDDSCGTGRFVTHTVQGCSCDGCHWCRNPSADGDISMSQADIHNQTFALMDMWTAELAPAGEMPWIKMIVRVRKFWRSDPREWKPLPCMCHMLAFAFPTAWSRLSRRLTEGAERRGFASSRHHSMTFHHHLIARKSSRLLFGVSGQSLYTFSLSSKHNPPSVRTKTGKIPTSRQTSPKPQSRPATLSEGDQGKPFPRRNGVVTC